jgi:hypothetical protein
MTNPTPQRTPLLERSIDWESLLISAAVLIAWAAVTVVRELLLPLLRWALRWPPVAPEATPAETTPPALLPRPVWRETVQEWAPRVSESRNPARVVLAATPLQTLLSMAELRGIDVSGIPTREELIDALLDDRVTALNRYEDEVPTPQQRNRARGFL